MGIAIFKNLHVAVTIDGRESIFTVVGWDDLRVEWNYYGQKVLKLRHQESDLKAICVNSGAWLVFEGKELLGTVETELDLP
jgi:hypothetical protein